jgi:hypothetical protein
MKLFTIHVFALGVLLFCAQIALALPTHYTATGSLSEIDGQLLNISGWVDIDSQLRYWGGQPCPTDFTEFNAKAYYISGYSLQFGEHTFLGTSGSLYLELGPDNIMADRMWFLGNLYGEQFLFLNEDGKYNYLADMILLNGFEYDVNQILFPEQGGLNLWLTRQESTPVPEPVTFVLFGSCLLGMLVSRRLWN